MPRTPLYVAALNAILYIIFAIALSGWIGAAGIALANTIAFSGEALLLLLLLNRRVPRLVAQLSPGEGKGEIRGILQIGPTLLRAILACVAGALVASLVLRLPLHPLLLGLGALAAGGLTVLPLIWPEIKILIKL